MSSMSSRAKSGERRCARSIGEGVAFLQADIARQVRAGALEPFGGIRRTETVRVLFHGAADVLQTLDILRQIAVVDVALQVRGVAPNRVRAPFHRHRRVVAKLVVVKIGVGDVEAEPVGAALQPQIENVERCLLRIRVSPAEFGLLAQGICSDGAGAAPADTPRPVRRTPTASCSARYRRARDRPCTPTSPISLLSSENPGTMHAHRRCGQSTSSSRTRMPFAWAAAISASKSASEP